MRSMLRRRAAPILEMVHQPRPPIHTEAMAMIRACIEGVRWSTTSEGIRSEKSAGEEAAAVQFRQDVSTWLGAVRRASEKRWKPSEAWQVAFRPHLALIVGPTARSELGRAADHAGYQLLAHEYHVLCGSYVPLQPSLSGPEVTDQDGMDAELAAAFHTLPESFRYGPAAATRLLGILVRLAAARPLDDGARRHLATLNGLAGA